MLYRLCIQLWLGFFIACFAYADQAQYLYDDRGHLTSVADSTGALALYNYDSVGNLLSIASRLPAAGLGSIW